MRLNKWKGCFCAVYVKHSKLKCLFCGDRGVVSTKVGCAHPAPLTVTLGTIHTVVSGKNHFTQSLSSNHTSVSRTNQRDFILYSSNILLVMVTAFEVWWTIRWPDNAGPINRQKRHAPCRYPIVLCSRLSIKGWPSLNITWRRRSKHANQTLSLLCIHDQFMNLITVIQCYCQFCLIKSSFRPS